MFTRPQTYKGSRLKTATWYVFVCGYGYDGLDLTDLIYLDLFWDLPSNLPTWPTRAYLPDLPGPTYQLPGYKDNSYKGKDVHRHT